MLIEDDVRLKGSKQEMSELVRNAILSADRVQRFKLTRNWDLSLPMITWVLHNPSKADESADDPTVRKVIGFSRRWGYGGASIYNGIAARATNPSELKDIPWNSAENQRHLEGIHHEDRVMCAWGNTDWPTTFSALISQLLSQKNYLWCLGRTLSGNPKHPVRLGYNTQWQKFYE